MGSSPWCFEELDMTELLTLLLLLSIHSRCVSYDLEEDPAILSNLQPRVLLELKSRVLETVLGRFLSKGSWNVL